MHFCLNHILKRRQSQIVSHREAGALHLLCLEEAAENAAWGLQRQVTMDWTVTVCVSLSVVFNSATPQAPLSTVILQVRIAEWVAISFSRDLPKPRIEPSSPALAGGFFTLSHLGSPWTRLGVGKVRVAQLCPTLCDPMDCIVHGILQARKLEWGSLSLLQGIFTTQGSNPGLLHCTQRTQADSSPAEPQAVGNPRPNGHIQHTGFV